MKLNLGCGSRFHKDWINIDFHSSAPGVRAYNLLRGIPLPDNYVDVVYHSHLLEHFPMRYAQAFIKECTRVLKPGGIIRVVVPDLEDIVNTYLKSLADAKAGKGGGDAHYEWAVIELLDQMVREKSGGEMLTYLSADTVPAKEFILERLGVEAKRIMEKVRNVQEEREPEKLVIRGVKTLARLLQRGRVYLASALTGVEYASVEVGRFRNSGEVHKWMYDSYSLKRILEVGGFVNVVRRDATESYITDWLQYHLDTEPDGSVYKPDSLYMEGRKSNF